MNDLFLAALGDREAAANYRRLAALLPAEREHYSRCAQAAEESFRRNMDARSRLYGRRKRST